MLQPTLPTQWILSITNGLLVCVRHTRRLSSSCTPSRTMSYTSNCKRNGHFLNTKSSYSGAIFHSFCIFNVQIRIVLAFVLQFATSVTCSCPSDTFQRPVTSSSFCQKSPWKSRCRPGGLCVLTKCRSTQPTLSAPVSSMPGSNILSAAGTNASSMLPMPKNRQLSQCPTTTVDTSSVSERIAQKPKV